MADENIPEKLYTELTRPHCPKCENPLDMDDPGCWYCDFCDYSEYNNITFCQGECCGNLVMSQLSKNNMVFDYLEDRYCQVKNPDDGWTCLGFAQSEQDHFEAEQQKLEEHMKHCSNEFCECKNV